MIPRRAAFFWSSPSKVPWIRWAAPISFAIHNPEWVVELYTDSPKEEEPPEGGDRVHVRKIERPPQISKATWAGCHVAAKSDLWRYWFLHEHGGLYADTDVVFYGSFDPFVESLEKRGAECAITQDAGWKTPLGIHISIGIMISSPGCAFFSRLLRTLEALGPRVGYQDAGVIPMANGWPSWSKDVAVANLPASLVYGRFHGKASAMKAIWSPGNLDPGTVSLHWFGGGTWIPGINQENWKHWICCPIGKALERGLGPVVGPGR